MILRTRDADWTTEEIEPEMPRAVPEAKLAGELLELMRRGDLVKFAKRQPNTVECQAALEFARDLVIATKPGSQDEEGAA